MSINPEAPDPDAGGLTPAQRLILACEMHDLGVAIMRQNLRRRHPDATDAKIADMLTKWLQTRPGAEYGDVSGPGLKVVLP